MSILAALKNLKKVNYLILMFFSSLKDCGISKKEYQIACDV